MRCPNCASLDTQVKDSRPTEDSSVIRRRRVCLSCNFRFTTFERVQLRELVVIKRNGRRVPFDRDKLLRSVQIALRKRPVEPERIDQAVSKIVREMESQGESEVSSEAVGELVMEALRSLDDVAMCASPRSTAISERPRISSSCSASCRARTSRSLRRPRESNVYPVASRTAFATSFALSNSARRAPDLVAVTGVRYCNSRASSRDRRSREW